MDSRSVETNYRARRAARGDRRSFIERQFKTRVRVKIMDQWVRKRFDQAFHRNSRKKSVRSRSLTMKKKKKGSAKHTRQRGQKSKSRLRYTGCLYHRTMRIDFTRGCFEPRFHFPSNYLRKGISRSRVCDVESSRDPFRLGQVLICIIIRRNVRFINRPRIDRSPFATIRNDGTERNGKEARRRKCVDDLFASRTT